MSVTITSKRFRLEQWLPTAHFKQIVDLECDRLDSADYFCDPKNGWLRDALVASRFAVCSNARAVRLVPRPDTRPDFEVRLRNGDLMSVEATQVDLPGRRRGDEYRALKKAGYPHRVDPVENWEKRRDAILPGITRAAQSKARISYTPGTSLLIYVNLGTYGNWRDEIERKLSEAVGPARNKFRSIWVLWSGRLYRCWPNPAISPQKVMRPKQIILGQWRNRHELSKLF